MKMDRLAPNTNKALQIADALAKGAGLICHYLGNIDT